MVVLVIASSFLGLFGMQADHYRSLELEHLADAITDLVTETDLLTCDARVEVDWTNASEAHGLPRTFHGEPYLVQFSGQRPYLLWDGHRVAGRHFPSEVTLVDGTGEAVDLLEVSSTTGFVIESRATWAEWGLDHRVSIAAIA